MSLDNIVLRTQEICLVCTICNHLLYIQAQSQRNTVTTKRQVFIRSILSGSLRSISLSSRFVRVFFFCMSLLAFIHALCSLSGCFISPPFTLDTSLTGVIHLGRVLLLWEYSNRQTSALVRHHSLHLHRYEKRFNKHHWVLWHMGWLHTDGNPQNASHGCPVIIKKKRRF